MSRDINREILELARARVANRETWCKGHSARMPSGRVAAGRDELAKAVKFCGFGALYRSAYDLLGDVDKARKKAWEIELQMLRGGGIAAINDGKDGRRRVLALFDTHLEKMRSQ